MSEHMSVPASRVPSLLDAVRYEGSVLPFRGLWGTVIATRVHADGNLRYTVEMPVQEGLPSRQLLNGVRAASLHCLEREV